MKKTVWVMMLCLLLNVSVNECKAEKMYGISEIKNEVEMKWTESCESKKNNVDINIPIYVPDVSELPVLRVKRTMISDKKVKDAENRITKNTIYGQRIENKDKFEFAENVMDFYQEYHHNLWTNNENLSDIFAENQEISLAEAIDFQKEIVSEFYGEEGIGCLPYRAGVKSCKYYNLGRGNIRLGEKAESGDMTGKGAYYVESWETINQIPCISGIERTYSDVGHKYVQSALSNMSWIVLGEYIDYEYYTCIATSMWKETGIEAADIKLCEFEKIKEEIRSMIRNGKIKEVYGITLGYVVFADKTIVYPENDSAYYHEYIAMPTWCVECKYSPRGIDYEQNSGDDLDAQSYHKEKGWRYLFINAQTGKVYDPEDNSNNRYFAPQILK